MDIKRFNPHLPAFTDDPYPTYAYYQEYDPVHWGLPHAPGQEGCWYLFGYRDVAAVLKDPCIVRKWPPGASAAAIARAPSAQQPFLMLSDNLLVSKDPPDHQRLRGLVDKTFGHRAMEAQRGMIQTNVEALIEHLQDRAQFDLINEFALPLSLRVICQVMGIPPEQEADLRHWSNAVADGINLREDSTSIEAASVGTLQLMDYFRQLFAERRRHPQNDLLTHLLDASEKEGHLAEDEMLAICIQIVFAGYETSINFLANAMLALLQHPAQRTKLQQEPTLLRNAINELFRFTGSVQTTAVRRPKKDVCIGGKWIRAGEPVIAFLGAANRDPAVFANPHRLDILGSTKNNIAFGVGIHACLGRMLACIEAEVMVHSLLRHWPQLHLAPDQTLRWRQHVVLRGLETLWISTSAA